MMAGIPTIVNLYVPKSATMARMHPQPSEIRAFALALSVLINERGWTQRSIARAMGLSHPQVRAYLDGTQEPGFFKVVALADAADVSLDWLAGREKHLPRVVIDDVRYVPAAPHHAPTNGDSESLDPRDPATTVDRFGEVLAAAEASRESRRRLPKGSRRRQA